MRNKIIRYGLWLIFATILLLLTAINTSPLSDFIGSDSVMYRLMGQCWHNGGIVYVDLFDNKGPYLYLIEMLGICISPHRWGIFILQVINIAIAIELLYRIVSLFTSTLWLKLFASISTILLTTLLFEGGNLTEDWSLCFILLPLYLSLKWMQEPYFRHPLSYTFVYGICFGIVSLIRLNNTAVFVGIIIGISLFLIFNKLYRALGTNALVFIAGTATALAPMLIYFGINNALDDMLYCTLAYNLKYAEVWPTIVASPILRNITLLLPCFIAMPAIVIYDVRHRSYLSFIILPAAAVTIVAFIHGSGFYHYYVLTIPFFLLAQAACFGLKRIVAVIFIVCLFANPEYLDRICHNSNIIAQHNVLFSNIKPDIHPYYQISAKIPQNERDSIFAYNLKLVQNDLFIGMNALPAMKYSYMHDEISQVDTLVENEIGRYMATQRPLWIAIPSEKSDSCISAMLRDYKLTHKTKVINLYRRNDSIIASK